MAIPLNVIVNADDLGLSQSVNDAILFCFENNIINSTSLLTNTSIFNDTQKFISNNPIIKNVGVHINLAEGQPVSNFTIKSYLDVDGRWDINKTNRVINKLNHQEQVAFTEEIHAQIEKALTCGVIITHIDSHYHLHTLPCFYKLFFNAAKRYKLKIRLAQTYREGSYVKYMYRRYINSVFKKSNVNYSDCFENVQQFLANGTINAFSINAEIMLHPYFDSAGNLSDHYDRESIMKWLAFIDK